MPVIITGSTSALQSIKCKCLAQSTSVPKSGLVKLPVWLQTQFCRYKLPSLGQRSSTAARWGNTVERKKRTSVENKAYGFSSPSLASFVKEATNMYVLLCECRETRFRPLDTGSVFVVQFIYMFCHVFWGFALRIKCHRPIMSETDIH